MVRAGDRRHASRRTSRWCASSSSSGMTPDAPRRALGSLGPSHDRCAARLLPAGPAGAAEAGALRRRRPFARGGLSSLADTDFDVIVIGAGLAGLHAAATLEAVGLRVLVLEAQRRVGGRIHSMRQLGRHGGSRRHVHRRRLCARHRRRGAARRRAHGRDADPRVLSRAGPGARRRDHSASASGRRIPPTISRSATKQHLPWTYHRVLTMRDNPLEDPSDWLDARHAALDVSAHDWLRSLGLSERAIALAYGLNVSFGRDAHDVSALLLLFRGAFSKQQRALAPVRRASASRRATACSGIPEAMAAALANGVELDHAVTAIALEDDRAVVTCANGRRFSARHVIAAVPPPVLRRIAIEPEAAGAASRRGRDVAVAAVDAGLSRAAQPVLGARRLRCELVHGHARRHARRRAQSRRPDRGHELHGVDHRRQRGGARSLAAPADAGRAVIAAIETLRPPRKASSSSSACTRGAPTLTPAARGPIFGRAKSRASRPCSGRAHGRLHFCGEHLATTSRGMEGAMESAEEAAAAILENV